MIINEFNNIYFIPQRKDILNNYYESIFLDSNKNIIHFEKKHFDTSNINNNNIQNILKNENIININDKCIYLGFFTKHYGHFIIESLSRFWIFLKNNSIEDINEYKYIFTKGPVNSDSTSDLNNEPFKHILKSFNINFDNIIYINETIYKFTNLYVPNKYIYLNESKKYNKLHKNIFDNIVNYTLSINKQNIEKYDKIFIYRGLKDNRIDLTIENNIVNIFKKYNFKIIQAYKHTFNTDILYYNNCKIIAGVEGTNIHNILFCKKNTILIGIAGNRKNSFNDTQISCNNITESINYWFNREYYKNLNKLEDELKIILMNHNLLN